MPSIDDHAFSLPSVLAKSLAKHADRTALILGDRSGDGPTDSDPTARNVRLTYRELNRRSNAVANELRERGVGLEDRVGVLLANSWQFVVADHAVTKAGGTRLPVNEMLTGDEIRYILADAGASGVVCDAAYLHVVRPLLEASGELNFCLVVGDGTESDAVASFESVLAAGDRGTRPDVSPSPEQVAAHFYTSGTTGRPKGVVHTHRSVVLNLHANATALDIGTDERQLLMTPLTHSAGVSLWSGLLRGATAVVRDGFDADRALADVDAYDVSWTYMVPTMIYRVLDRHDPADHDVSGLRTLAYGSAPMSPARLREALELFGPVFVQFYGQTEVPQIVTTLGKREHEYALEAGRERLLASAGKPELMSDARIVDVETGERLSVGEEGEIAATAPYRLREYHDRQEATEETLSDGWVRTGDIGRIDEEGYLYLLGRKHDMVVTGGMNVYPAEVEDALAEHPAVGSVAVFGVPHDDWGEAVTAAVVSSDEVTEGELLSFADETLADYKKPKSVKFVDELPTTSYGKVDKQALRAPYWTDAEREIS
jgi:fatty-acyl-CoA synthase/long-chain acyl-CoA synthetase